MGTGELWAGEELGLGLPRPIGEGRIAVAPPKEGVVEVMAVLEMNDEDLEGGIMDEGRVAGKISFAPAKAISFMACNDKRSGW